MTHKKTIAVIGAVGTVGTAIAKCLSRYTYRLLLMDRALDRVNHLCSSLNQESVPSEIEGVTSAREAAWEADIIIVATPYGEGREIAESIREVAIGKIVVSVSQPITGSFNATSNDATPSAAEELQKLLPNSKVVKTFNPMFSLGMLSLSDNTQLNEAFIAGNNGDAVETVGAVLKRAGLTPILVGDLSMSRTLERVQYKLMQENLKIQSSRMRGWKSYLL